MARSSVVYQLIDPRTDEIRYVGKTVVLPTTRLSNHISDARRNEVRHCCRWIRGLLNEGLRPVLEIIEHCTTENDSEREMYWIARYRQEGKRLTNLTDGGEGFVGFVPSAEVIAKRTAAVKKAYAENPEIALRIAKANRGKFVSNETRKRIGDIHRGKVVSDATRRKISEANLRRPVGSSAKALTYEIAMSIHEMKADGKQTREIAKFLGVCRTTVQKVARGETWKQVKIDFDERTRHAS